MDYLAWNDAIAAYFFNEQMAERRVFLSVNETVLNEIGAPCGADYHDFLKAVRVGPLWVTDKSSACSKALSCADKWRTRGLQYPPYIAYLATFVLAAAAAAHDDDLSPLAFYTPLRTLLREEVDRLEFKKMFGLWAGLQTWSQHDKEGALGVFRCALPYGNVFVNVGLPRLQTVFLAEEQKHLPQFFADNHFHPHSPPSSTSLLRLLRHASFLRSSTRRLLDKTDQTSRDLSAALVGFVLDELYAWDGSIEEVTATKSKGSRQATAILRLILKLSPLSGRVDATARFKSAKPFPDDELHLKDGVNLWLCPEFENGWTWPLFRQDDAKKANLDAATLDWTRGRVFADKELGWRVTLPPADVRVFFLGKRDGLPDWIETSHLLFNTPFLVACNQSSRSTIETWGKQECDGFQEIVAQGLPPDWSLFRAKNAISPLAQYDVLNMPERNRFRLRLVGGIKTEGRHAFFHFAPPRIALEGADGTEEVICKNAALTPNDDGEWIFAPDAPIETPLCVTCKGESLTISLLPAGLRPSYPLSSLPECCPNVSCPPDIPTYFGSHLIFLGRHAGQIADWPREALPTTWQPVWAIVKVRRDVWRAHFIGDSLDAGVAQIKKNDWKAWREIFRRKTTEPMGIPKVRKFWKQCRQEAERL